MPRRSFIALGIVCAGLTLAASPLSAQEVKASGTNMFVPKVVESFSLADGSIANRVYFPGFITSDDPSNPLRLASMTCAGTSITTKEGDLEDQVARAPCVPFAVVVKEAAELKK